MYSRILVPPKNKSFFIFGPRGTGKTTWVKTTYPDGIYLDLLEAELFNDLIANPARLENFIPVNNKKWVIIDEIQRIPELLNEVHRLIESTKQRFVLTGSSARKLKRYGPNLLAGRALTYNMHPLTINELAGEFKLSHSLDYGLLPSVYTDQEYATKYLESYVQTYLQQEIQQEGLARSMAVFSRFLEAASFSQASVLNISEVARDASVERKVVENYFSILEDLMIGYRLPAFTKKAKRRIVAHPKFFFFDVGVYRTIRPKGPLDTPEEIEGIALETLFFQELKALNDYYNLGYKLYYYRTASGLEVDFVIYGKGGIKAFEIKRTRKIRPEMFKGLKAFLIDYPKANCYLFYGGNRVMSKGKIKIVPIKQALTDLTTILNLSKA